MFYYHALLNRQTGCFATIWLVATNGKKVSKREYLKVNVPSTCDQLIDYLLVRVPLPGPNLPLSLYLSSQLQYGVVKVYHQQYNIHLKYTRDIIERIEKFKVKKNIDMKKPGGAMSFPDALSLMEDNEWADDPLFGQMIDLTSISPSGLPRFEAAVTDGTLWSIPDDDPNGFSTADITALPGNITMEETAVPFIPPIEYLDFGEADPGFENFLDMAVICMPEPEESGRDTQERRGVEGADDEDVPTPPPQRGVKRKRKPRLDEDVPTPPPQRGVKRMRKPRLQVDRVTTIPQQQLEEQISNVFWQTADPPMAGDVRANPAHLLTRPCNSRLAGRRRKVTKYMLRVLPVDCLVMPLWDRVAVIPSYAERQSEQRQESSDYSSSEKAPSDDIGPQADHGGEQPLPSGQIPTVGSPGRRSPPGTAGMDVEMEAEGEEFLRSFEQHYETCVTFKNMLGTPSRRRMAHAFMILLECVTNHKLNAEQKEPYDDIWISTLVE